MNNWLIHVLTLVQSHGDGFAELALDVPGNALNITFVAFAPEDIAHILVVAIVQGLHGKEKIRNRLMLAKNIC